jgi:predicted nucleotidyltransferase
MAKTKAEIIKILKKYLKEVEKVCHVDKAILFGSYAYGRAGKQSDIDVAIFSKNVTDKNRLETMSKIIMLIDKLKLDIQPIVFSYEDYVKEDNDFIAKEIKRKGIEITDEM